MRIPEKKYRDLRWKRRSLEVLERDKGTCQNCGKTTFEVVLQAHHRNYTSDEPWNEPLENLVTLCLDCHSAEQKCLGPAARKVADALMKSNWMVKHREKLEFCIRQSLVTPEEIASFLDAKMQAHEGM